MKRLLTVIMSLLLMQAVHATIQISVTEYDSATEKGKIRLYNAGGADYTDLVLTVAGVERSYPGSLLKPDTAIQIPINIPPGPQTVTVMTSGGSEFRRNVNFAQFVEDSLADREQRDAVASQEREIGKEIRRAQQRFSPETQASGFNPIWLLIPIALVAFLIIFMVLRKRKPPLASFPPGRSRGSPRLQAQRGPTRVMPQNPQRARLDIPPPPAPVPPAQSTQHNVFETLPKSKDVFDKLPSKTPHIFAKLRALKK